MTPAELRLLAAEQSTEVEIVVSDGDLYLVQIRHPGGTSLLTYSGAAMCFHSLADCAQKLSGLGIGCACMVYIPPYADMMNNAAGNRQDRMPVYLH